MPPDAVNNRAFSLTDSHRPNPFTTPASSASNSSSHSRSRAFLDTYYSSPPPYPFEFVLIASKIAPVQSANGPSVAPDWDFQQALQGSLEHHDAATLSPFEI
jgi:hypothetical protein